MSSFVANISAFEEDSSYDRLNSETFDPQTVNFGNFDFDNQSWTCRNVFNSEKKRRQLVYKRIGEGDFVCSCGETIYDDNLICHHRFLEHLPLPNALQSIVTAYTETTDTDTQRAPGSALFRIYIPRIMTNRFSFRNDDEVKKFIFEQLSSFCNIIDIQLLWLHDACDLSAFVYLDTKNPIQLTPLGKTIICNLTCTKCHSNRVYVAHRVFWNLLPDSGSIGFISI